MARERSPSGRLTAADLKAARALTIRDVLPGPDDPPLRVLFCGINPGLVSAATGHHFARPGNRFWPVLHRSGFTPRQLKPAEQGELAALGLGITNLVARSSARADELTGDELVAGGVRLRALVARQEPAWLAVVGITAYRIAFDAPGAGVGPQEGAWGDTRYSCAEKGVPATVSAHGRRSRTRVWVLPNPSGLNAHWSVAAMAEEFGRLRAQA